MADNLSIFSPQRTDIEAKENWQDIEKNTWRDCSFFKSALIGPLKLAALYITDKVSTFL